MDCHIPAQRLRIHHTLSHLPGDKSISHRAVMLGALAENESVFTGVLLSEDCAHTIGIFQQMGVPIEVDSATQTVKIKGVGLHGLKQPKGVLDVGNSGTGIRLMSGILAAQTFPTQIAGDDSIAKRPMRRVIDPLTRMGAKITGKSGAETGEIYPPLDIAPIPNLRGIRYDMPVASAQVKSAILLAGLYAEGETVVVESKATRDHTERFMRFLGLPIHVSGSEIKLTGRHPLQNPTPNAPLRIPADPSSAAFFGVLGILVPNSRLSMSGVGFNPTRSRLWNVLTQMGGHIELQPDQAGIEPMGTVTVAHSDLKNIEVSKADIPFIIDEIPILAAAAAFGKDTLKIRGAEELRVKESDRIATICRMITAMGGKITEYPDGFDIEGGTRFHEFEVDSHGDHRIAMSAIIAALAAGVPATVKNCECIQTSFPNFFECLAKLGAVN